MITYYNEFEIHINDNDNYTSDSVDNITSYDKIHLSEDNIHLSNSKYGVRILENEVVISSAIICESGGKTSAGNTSFIIADEVIFICCGDTVYALTIPALDLKWRKQLDTATCFEIYAFEKDFIVHGELAISRVTLFGEVLWAFSARDIFVNMNGHKEFEIIGEQMKVIDFENYEYILDENGQVLSDRLLK